MLHLWLFTALTFCVFDQVFPFAFLFSCLVQFFGVPFALLCALLCLQYYLYLHCMEFIDKYFRVCDCMFFGCTGCNRIPEPNADIIKSCSPLSCTPASHNIVGAAPLPTTCADDHVSVLPPVGVLPSVGVSSGSPVVRFAGAASVREEGVSVSGARVLSVGDGTSFSAVVEPVDGASAVVSAGDEGVSVSGARGEVASSRGDVASLSAVGEAAGDVSAVAFAHDEGVSAHGDVVASLSGVVSSARGDGAVVLPASPADANNANDDDDDDDDEELAFLFYHLSIDDEQDDDTSMVHLDRRNFVPHPYDMEIDVDVWPVPPSPEELTVLSLLSLAPLAPLVLPSSDPIPMEAEDLPPTITYQAATPPPSSSPMPSPMQTTILSPVITATTNLDPPATITTATMTPTTTTTPDITTSNRQPVINEDMPPPPPRSPRNSSSNASPSIATPATTTSTSDPNPVASSVTTTSTRNTQPPSPRPQQRGSPQQQPQDQAISDEAAAALYTLWLGLQAAEEEDDEEQEQEQEQEEDDDDSASGLVLTWCRLSFGPVSAAWSLVTFCFGLLGVILGAVSLLASSWLWMGHPLVRIQHVDSQVFKDEESGWSSKMLPWVL
ncbi:hypothetical protein LRAMOSA11123 [Lichtheimia ramosa]|uniref:Uncharacterized protein n=1 Tax=Lichtheimia ramosa TaxID=688394 RepID=A0A077WV98_9FUNG|nr:hypothetical protein LRAMOSA11123 [Lichtheimia ramosa]